MKITIIFYWQTFAHVQSTSPASAGDIETGPYLDRDFIILKKKEKRGCTKKK